MKLPRNMDRLLGIVTVFILSFVLAFAANHNNHDTYAGNESGVYEVREEKFVTFYDDGEKLIVKTTAETVAEALERAGIRVAETDIVEPAVDSAIDGENYFVNIHRARPAVVKDGERIKYVMTASYDAKSVATDAGFTVYDGDEVVVMANTNFLEAGAASQYEIIRNGGRMVTEEIEIEFEEETVKDYDLAPGMREVRQLGEVGMMTRTYEVFYEDNVETKRELVREEVKREPVARVVAVGASEIERTPLTMSMGRNRYTIRTDTGVIERQETYYDLPMQGVMNLNAAKCGVEAYYTVREDGVKVDPEGYVLVAANLARYPRCSVVETSLGLGKVYDTGTFAETNPEQFDIATDWSNRDGK